VEDAADRWDPPVGDSEARDLLVGGRRDGEGCWHGGGSWAAVHCAGWAEELGRAAGRREGGEKAGRGEGKRILGPARE